LTTMTTECWSNFYLPPPPPPQGIVSYIHGNFPIIPIFMEIFPWNGKS
jgi:hypothetical protein